MKMYTSDGKAEEIQQHLNAVRKDGLPGTLESLPDGGKTELEKMVTEKL